MDTILEMRNICKDFNGVPALENVNFTIERGEIHALVGENGAGKSTLMNILSGLFPYGDYSGQIILNGEEQRFRSITDSEKKGIVIIHQELALSPYLSVAENVFMGNNKYNRFGIINWGKINKEATVMLRKVGLENENVNRPVNQLGVGKQQLIEIAKALAKDVSILVLDEPTSALNDEESELLLRLLVDLKAQGITSIIISHKLHEICEIADKITVLRDGHTIETLTDKKDIKDENRIIKGMIGRDVSSRFPPREPVIGDVAFEVEHWNVTNPNNPERLLIDDVSFNVRRGEVVGIAGLMGSGRTELAMSIFGKSIGTNISGVVRKNGKEVDVSTVDRAIKNGIAYMTEDRKAYGLVLFNDIIWNISLSNLLKVSKNGVLQRHMEEKMAQDSARSTKIKAHSLRQRVDGLSGGNQQKVLLSKWLAAAPDVLILDEPTRGIDVGAKYEIYCVINELAAMGKSVIVISSEMGELLGMSDRIYVLCEGVIAGEFERQEASQEKIMKAIMDCQARRSK